MSRRLLVPAAALASLGVVWFAWQLGKPEPEPGISLPPAESHGKPAVDKPVAHTAKPGESVVSPENAVATSAKLEEFLSDSTKRKASAEKVAEQFLAKHGETPANLLALFNETGDRKYLDRALERFPN